MVFYFYLRWDFYFKIMKRIVVIGSGIAGLAAAKHCNSKNFNITVLDKGKYPGGRISTRKNKEFIFASFHSLSLVSDFNFF